MGDDFEGVTIPSGYDDTTRVLVAPGILARTFIVDPTTLGAGYAVDLMGADREPITAAELDAMTPDQRHAAVSERIVTDLDEVPPAFRDRVIATAERLAAERRA